MKKIIISIFVASYLVAGVSATDVEAKYTNKSIKIEATSKPVQNINLGFANTTGNTKTTNLNAKYSLTHLVSGLNNEELKYIFNLSGYLTKSNGTRINEEYMATLSAEQFLVDGWLGYATFSWLKNEFKNYNNKFSIIAGVGKSIFDDGRHKVILKVGPGYNIEQYSNTQTDKSYGSINEYLEYTNKLNDISNLYLKVGALQNIEDVSNDYEATALLGVDFAMGGGISISLEQELAYDNLPPTGFKKSDTKSIVRVGYKF